MLFHSNFRVSSRLIATITACLTIAGIAGCNQGGANLGKVTGKVTLAGTPLPNALVTFTPTNGGSPSVGRTLSDGAYNLNFSRKLDGAVIGEHTVSISTYVPALEDPATPEVPEKVPFKYRESEQLPKVTVKSGSNKLDFALENGPIQPPAGRKKAKSPDAPSCY
jgi:hypothetical protein